MLSLEVIRKLTDIPAHLTDRTVEDLRDQLYLMALMAFDQQTLPQRPEEAVDEQG